MIIADVLLEQCLVEEKSGKNLTLVVKNVPIKLVFSI
jgi:hypothetical protein